MTRSRPPMHPVHLVHRVTAAALGLGLWVFAALGFANGLAFFSTQGAPVLGLSSNGLLSTISVVAGAVLLASAAWKGPLASTVTAVIGVLFVVSGIAHLAILHTTINILAFRLPNVFFSLIAGLILVFAGTYGRISGGLPPDNPYRRAHPRRTDPPSPDEQLRSQTEPDENEQRLLEAEMALGEGHATAEQTALVERDHAQRRAREIERAYRHAADTNTASYNEADRDQ